MPVSREKGKGLLLRFPIGNRIESLAIMHRIQMVSKRVADYVID